MRVTLVAAVAAILATASRPARADERSEGVATLLAIGGTAAPVGVYYLWRTADPRSRGLQLVETAGLFATIELAPAAGAYYAGDYWTSGMAVRGSGLLAILIGVAVENPVCQTGPTCSGDELWRDVASVGLGLVGLGAILTGDGLDIVHAGDAAQAYNAAHADAAPRTHMHMLSFGGRF